MTYADTTGGGAEKSAAVRILYHDAALCAAVKRPGVLSEADGGRGMPEMLAAALGVSAVWPVHRLDRETGGVMVYALTKESAARLSASFAEGKTGKRYYAAVSGTPEAAEGEWRDLIYHDPVRNKSFRASGKRRGVREAVLRCRVVKTFEARDGRPAGSVLDITLLTGRTHQIRAQSAFRGHPLLGDRRYGSRCGGPMALWCYELSVPHPADGRSMTFSCPPEEESLLSALLAAESE